MASSRVPFRQARALVIILLATGAGVPAQAEIRFAMEAAPRFAIGPACRNDGCFVRGDVNGDGHDDLVIDESFGSGGIRLFLSSPGGLVEGPSVEGVDLEVRWLALGDVDEDGAVDLLCCPGTGGGLILLGDGDGAFSRPPVEFGAGNGTGLALADINGDGLLDTLTGSSYRLGREGVEFDEPVPFAQHELGPTGDLDGDGRPEICVWRRTGSQPRIYEVRTFGWDGETLTELATMQSGEYPLRLVDLDGDGVPDLVSGSSCVIGRGDGSFAEPPVPLPLAVSDVADFDGDGQLDLLGHFASGPLSSVGAVGVSLAVGDGGFGPPVHVITGGRMEAVAALDADADGVLDVLAARYGVLGVVRGESGGAFARPTGFFPHEHPRTVFGPGTAGDFDGDGHLDIILRGELFRGTGDGRLAPAPIDTVEPNLQAWLLGYNTNGTVVHREADLDRDGRGDLVRVADGSYIEVLWREADGSMTPASVAAGLPLNPTLVLADFDRDGTVDIAVTNNKSNGEVLVFDGDGNRGFSTPRTFAIPNKMSAWLLSGDFNGDGAVDLFILYDGTKILFNNGDGTFNDEEPLFFESEWPVAVGDFDEDGRDDLFYRDRLLLMGLILDPVPGPTRFPGLSLPAGYELRSVADLDGDGHLDVVLIGQPPETLLVIAGTGAGGLGVESSDRLPFSLDELLLGDFDEDGAVDIAGSTQEGVLVLKNLTRTTRFRRGVVNGDGVTDISDAVTLLECLFRPAISHACRACPDAQDVNDDGGVDISDAISLLSWLFRGAATPATPFGACGDDPTADALDCPEPGPACP